MSKIGTSGKLSAVMLLVAACSSSKQPADDTGDDVDAGQDQGGGHDSGGSKASVPDAGRDADSADSGETEASTDPLLEGGDLIPLDQGQVQQFQACSGAASETEPKPVMLEMVVDVSGSMNQPAPGDSSHTKWEITQQGLINAMKYLPSNAWVGVTFFPDMATTRNEKGPVDDISLCINTKDNVSLAVLGKPQSDQRNKIKQAFANAQANPNAGTPTHDAYNLALAELKRAPDLGQKYMLLITDGQPTFLQGCYGTGSTMTPVDEQPVVDAIAAANSEDSIKTFLIGSPGSEKNESTGADARGWLSRAAELGGTAKPGCSSGGPNYCHQDMTQADNFAVALGLAMMDITSTLVSCTYQVTPPEAGTGDTLDTSQVNFFFKDGDQNSYIVAFNATATDSSCQRGWRYTKADGTEVELCSRTCEKIKEQPGAAVEVELGCKSVVFDAPR